jgi:hypothetical protein
MRNDEHANAGVPGYAVNGAKIVEQPDLFGHILDHRPDLPTFGQEVIVGVDEQQTGRIGFVL